MIYDTIHEVADHIIRTHYMFGYRYTYTRSGRDAITEELEKVWKMMQETPMVAGVTYEAQLKADDMLLDTYVEINRHGDKLDVIERRAEQEPQVMPPVKIVDGEFLEGNTVTVEICGKRYTRKVHYSAKKYADLYIVIYGYALTLSQITDFRKHNDIDYSEIIR